MGVSQRLLSRGITCLLYNLTEYFQDVILMGDTEVEPINPVFSL
jgi:hypothetical protein